MAAGAGIGYLGRVSGRTPAPRLRAGTTFSAPGADRPRNSGGKNGHSAR
jgi:hypothetical protein